MILYAVTIFLSAYLLFQVQPMVAKIILPWFGGSAAVWTVCMLFFQLVLLAGYLYAHALMRLRPERQRLLHIALLAAGIAALPIIPSVAWKPAGGDDPTLRILGLLASSIGLPYFLLSTTGPLAQAWYARAHQGAAPYRLFALSNFGSMLALLSYPVLVEPLLALRSQTAIWSAGFGLFVLVCAVLAWRSRDAAAPLQSPGGALQDSPDKPGPGLQALWVGLACCASVLLLAITSHISLNIAAIPFLWVLPLALYLASFIVCFDAPRWYRRDVFLPIAALGIAGGAAQLTYGGRNPALWLLIPAFCGALFAVCMVCHGELARTKPHPRHLTGFYLMLALGGALGGVMAGLVAPHLFNDLYEMPIGMIGFCLLVFAALQRDRSSILHGRMATPARVAILGLTLALGALFVYQYNKWARAERVIERNFYGVLKVRDIAASAGAERILVHGTIYHGKQFLDPERRDWPTSYYGRESGIGLAILDAGERGPLRVGLVGLGTGTLAAYGRRGDIYRFYEINPLVIGIARSEFSFLEHTQAEGEVVLGDARLSMEREPGQNFDILALDAFSSDAIPVHLLTLEAFGLYLRHLKPGGILAVHISNRFLYLVPVLQQAARHYSLQARIVINADDEAAGVYKSDWVLLSTSAAALESDRLKPVSEALESHRQVAPWTDDYSNLFRILKY